MSRGTKLALGALTAGLVVAFAPALGAPQASLGSVTLGGFWTVPLLFLAGVLTSLTPCVYPLIPITVSIFGARGASSRGRAAALSATYVGGIATMYSLLGVGAALSGRAFGTFMGNPWVAGGFALVMVAFALSMFGLFEIQLPAGLQQRLSGVSGAGFGSAFAMGLVAGVVAAPCTGPVLGAVLTWIASTRNAWAGFGLMFDYALGMGLLFFVLGTFSVRLPRSGAWMEAVKTVLGVALLLVACTFVRPLLPRAPEVGAPAQSLAALSVAAAAFAVLTGAVDRSFHGNLSEKLVKAGGIALLVGAVALRVGWIVEPKPEVSAEARIVWVTTEADALAQAKATGRPVLVDFGAEWCAACMELKRITFADPAVAAEVSRRFVAWSVDATDPTDEIDALHAKYGVVGMPLVTVLDTAGRQLAEPRITGFLAPTAFLAELAKVK